jgi:hypothetical protein
MQRVVPKFGGIQFLSPGLAIPLPQMQLSLFICG